MHRLIFFIFVLLYMVPNLFAVSFYGNLSEIRYKTAGTEHFHYHYPAEYTSHAEKVAAIAEAVYDSVNLRYGLPLPSKVHLSLHNALYSNGLAIPAENSMNLWLTNWDFKVRSSHGWLSDVVTHEFSHLVSIESGSKVVPSLYGIQISYTDYYNERTRQDGVTLLPLTLQPLWLAEGTAQFESERMGFDYFDAHRDMLLRTAVLSDSLLPLEYMNSFSENSLKAELGPYTQGYSLVRYLAKQYGEDIVPKIWNEFSKPYRITISGALEKTIGIDEDSLYANWQRELKNHYQNQKESLGELVEGTKITTDAFYNDYPTIVDGYVYGVSNFGGNWFDGGIFKMRKNLDSIQSSDFSEDSLMILSFEGTVDIKEYADSKFKPKKIWVDKGIAVKNVKGRGPLLAYVSYQNKNKHGRSAFDIFVTDTLGENQEITYLADAIYPDIHPNGNEIIFVRRENSSTRFVLSKAPIDSNPKARAKEFQDIWKPNDSLAYYNIYTPKYSPDGSQIAFSFFDDKNRGIALVNADGTNFQILTEQGIDSRDPTWLDNETLVYSADKNGIFNLFKFHIPSKTEEPLTNVLGGAFNPTYDNETLFYVGYDADGFSLYKLDLPKEEKSLVKVDTVLTPCAVPPFAKKDTPLFISLFAKDSSQIPSCLPQGKILVQDSILPKKASIVLKGSPLKNPRTKPAIFDDISFAGSEKKYKPIPTIPLFVPLVSFEERSPDFSVSGDGNTLAKIGTAVILSDPLKKNTLQMGLLFEVTNGLDYIDGSGINPDKQYDFFALLENRSFPITLQLGYTYTNLTSKDTVRYEDPRSYGDSIGVSNYAVPLHNLFAGAGYSFFKQGDTLALSLGYDFADFNLYEDGFEWTYQKRLSFGALLGIFKGFPEEGSNTSGLGNGIGLSYKFSNSDLFRSGTFSETFVVNANGTISPIYRNFNIHEIGFSTFGSIGNPIHPKARLALGASVTGILNWNTSDTPDTLDSYYNHPLLLNGYPYLISTEDYNRSGTKTATAEVHYLFPIYNDWRKNLWIFETRDFYVDIFAQVGAAWSSKWFDTDKFKSRDFWDRSVGIEFRLANTLFYTVPFDISLNIARGLDRIGEDEFGKGGKKMNPIDIPLIPSSLAPTRIHFSIGTGFRNSWQNQ